MCGIPETCVTGHAHSGRRGPEVIAADRKQTRASRRYEGWDFQRPSFDLPGNIVFIDLINEYLTMGNTKHQTMEVTGNRESRAKTIEMSASC